MCVWPSANTRPEKRVQVSAKTLEPSNHVMNPENAIGQVILYIPSPKSVNAILMSVGFTNSSWWERT